MFFLCEKGPSSLVTLLAGYLAFSFYGWEGRGREARLLL